MTKIIRSQTSYQALNDRFSTFPPTLTASSTTNSGASKSNGTGTGTGNNQQPYNRQYCSIYKARLDSLKPKCLYTFHQRNKNKDNKDNKDNDDNVTIVNRIIELKEDTTSLIIGTIVKNCTNKPKLNLDTQAYHESDISYLGTPYDDDNDNNNKDKDNLDVEAPLAKSTYCSVKEDILVLEDESGRIELNFDTDSNSNSNSNSDSNTKKKSWKLDLVTGVIMGIKGKINLDSNLFDVDDIYYPTPGSHRPIDKQQQLEQQDDDDNDDTTILLMSGLDCGGHDYNQKRNSSTSLKRELVIDYITGYFNNNNDDNGQDDNDTTNNIARSESIARVIIAGGGCTKPIRPEHSTAHSWSTSTNTNANNSSSSSSKNKNEALQQRMKETTLPIRELDLFLTEICSHGIPVDYIPGLYDPTNTNWPQKPIHECLVPNANMFTNMLHRTTNPYEACLGDKVLLGSDGLNISDLRCYLGQEIEDSNDDDGDGDTNNANNSCNDDKDKKEPIVVPVPTIEALQSSLKFNHLVPTGPDSVPTFPFYKNDPFVIENTPHVYFCGNCDAFETKLIDIDVRDKKEEDQGCDDSSTYSTSNSTTTKVRLICIPSFVKTGQVVLLKLKSMECSVIEFDDVVMENVHDEKKME